MDIGQPLRLALPAEVRSPGAGRDGSILVLRLSRVEIDRSARRHQVPDEDISHAYEHPVAWVELGDDPLRYLLAGADRAGNLLELVVLAVQDDELVIHAMALRPSTRRELFGDDR